MKPVNTGLNSDSCTMSLCNHTDRKTARNDLLDKPNAKSQQIVLEFGSEAETY